MEDNDTGATHSGARSETLPGETRQGHPPARQRHAAATPVPEAAPPETAHVEEVPQAVEVAEVAQPEPLPEQSQPEPQHDTEPPASRSENERPEPRSESERSRPRYENDRPRPRYENERRESRYENERREPRFKPEWREPQKVSTNKVNMEKHLKIAIFIDFDNIEIGVKSTLQREFDVSVVLEALKERGEIVTKIAYANWGRMENSTRQLSEYAVQMVQRDPSPRGDKNGADINLALDALEMAFTHDHINAFTIVSGDSDFIALVNKLKQYDKTVFVVGGKAFTSTILQKNCHEFISYESMLDDSRSSRSSRDHGRDSGRDRQDRQHSGGDRQQAPVKESGSQAPPREAREPREQREPREPRETREQREQREPREQQSRRPALDLHQAMPLVERALQVLERREVRPQLGLLKSTMLQLDSSFSERAYGAGSFTDFIERLRKGDLILVTGGEGRYMISRKRGGAPEKTVRPEEALPYLRDVLEYHRIELEDGVTAADLQAWVAEESPAFDWKAYGFQEFTEFLNFSQDKTVVRVVPDETQGLLVYLGAEFHPPAVPEPEPLPLPDETEEDEGPQPVVPGQPTAGSERPKKGVRKTTGREVDGNVVPAPKRARSKSAAPRKRRAPSA